MIVGLGYNMGVGKDTAAEALCKELGFKRVGFADALKDLALKADPLITSATRAVNVNVGHGRLAWAVHGLGYENAKRTYPEVREFLQRLGSGAREVFGDTFWIDRVMEPAILRSKAGLHTVIPDVRYRNEADTIRESGGIVINITRPGYHGNGHVTETELNDYEHFHAVVDNNGSIVELQAKIVQIVRDELQRYVAIGAAMDSD